MILRDEFPEDLPFQGVATPWKADETERRTVVHVNPKRGIRTLETTLGFAPDVSFFDSYLWAAAIKEDSQRIKT